MYLYLFIYIFVSVLSLIFRGKSTFLLLIFSSFFLFFIGFRTEIGVDWNAYIAMKNQIQQFPNALLSMVFTEPGYGVLNFYAPNSDSGIYVVNIICALIFVLGLFIFCKDQKYPLLSFAIAIPYLIIVVAMGYTRQSAALGFVFLGYKAFANKNIKTYLVFSIMAFLFHFSAIVVFFLIFFTLNKKNFTKIFLLSVMLGLIVVLIFRENILDKLSFYGTDDDVTSQGGIFRHLLNLVPAIIFFIYIKFFANVSGKYFQLMKLFSLASVALFIMSFLLSTFADRLAIYFLIVQSMVYPYFINKFVNKDRFIVFGIVLIFYFVFMLVWFTSSNYAQTAWIPYKNYLLQ